MKDRYAWYHEIDDGIGSSYHVSWNDFTMQMNWLKDKGYKTLDPERGDLDTPFEGKRILITFDDGHKSNLRAAQYLHDMGFCAVFYILQEQSLTNPEYLSEADIKFIADLGHVIGVHDKNHMQWTKLSNSELIEDLKGVKLWLEKITGRRVVTCSAPGGFIRHREYSLIRMYIPELKYIRSSFNDFNHYGSTSLNSKGLRRCMPIEEFEKIVTLDKFYYFKLRICSFLKDRIKDIVWSYKYRSYRKNLFSFKYSI